MPMHLLTRHAFVLGLCVLPAAGAWAIDDLDVTIRVIERHERLEDFGHRIELPRAASEGARERAAPGRQNENGARFREAGERSAPERSRGEFERRVSPERAHEWSREREQGRDALRRDERRLPPDAGDRPRH